MTRSLAQTVAAEVFDAIETAHLHSRAISLSAVESAVEAAIAEHKREIEKDHLPLLVVGNTAIRDYKSAPSSVVAVPSRSSAEIQWNGAGNIFSGADNLTFNGNRLSGTSIAATSISCGGHAHADWHSYTVGPVSHTHSHTHMFVTDDKSCLPTIVNPK